MLDTFLDMHKNKEALKFSEKILIGDKNNIGLVSNICFQIKFGRYLAQEYVETLAVPIPAATKRDIRQSTSCHKAWRDYNGYAGADRNLSWKTNWPVLADDVYKLFDVVFERTVLDTLDGGIRNGQGPADMLNEGGCLHWLAEPIGSRIEALQKTNEKQASANVTGDGAQDLAASASEGGQMNDDPSRKRDGKFGID